MKLKLITVPNPLLRQKSLAVEKVDTDTKKFLSDLADTLLKKSDPPGVGLSAVQVGKLIRAFYIYLPPIYDLSTMADDMPPSELKLFLNPTIVKASAEMTLGPDPNNPALEGCLSVPALYGPVPRHQTITVSYQTMDNNNQLVNKTNTFANFYARVIQHEYDHLEGILFTDYTQKDHQNLYFDQGNKLVEIPKPNEIIQW